jgi:hypothetical protein
MMSALETLRAFSRGALPGNEKNEINERTPSQSEKTAPVRPDEALSSFNSFLSSPGNADDLDERAAIIEEGAGVPKRWAEGFAAMCSMPAPAGFSPERWQRIIDAAGVFIDKWAAKAIACGWSDLDVFGCDSAAPDRRFDCMGIALLLDRWEVSGIDEAGADLVTETGAPLRYRRRPLPGHTVSLWQLVK